MGAAIFRDFGRLAYHRASTRLLAWTLYGSPALCALIKGKPVVLVRDGAYQTKEMRTELISEEDFEKTYGSKPKPRKRGRLKIVRLEPSGDINFIMAKNRPNVSEERLPTLKDVTA